MSDVKLYLRKASKIVEKVFSSLKKECKPETSLLYLAELGEQIILDKNAIPAFPINLSLNEIAAHYTPFPEDKKVLQEGDLLKIDVGVCIEGWIVDSAITLEINDNKFKNLIKASKEALNNVLSNISKDTYLKDIGYLVENTIKSYGYDPIYNLFGHQIEKYLLHAGKNIPNTSNISFNSKLGEGIFAIEPFATCGKGYVEDYKPSSIYIISNPNAKIRIPSVKKIYNYMYNKYKTLPFCKRWILKDLSNFKKNQIELALSFLKQNNIIYEFYILQETSKKPVSQAEKTVYVKNTIEVYPGDID